MNEITIKSETKTLYTIDTNKPYDVIYDYYMIPYASKSDIIMDGNIIIASGSTRGDSALKDSLTIPTVDNLTTINDDYYFYVKQTPIITNISEPTNITTTGASFTVNIQNEASSPVTSRGVCWSLYASPTTSNSKTINGSGIGKFSGSINGLSPGTQYYLRAYATNTEGTTYSNQITFTTTT